jgi:hypothetical protein
MTEVVTDNAARSRFELALGADTAFVNYRRAGTVLVLTHAEVPAELEGRGVGSRLVGGALDLVRARGERGVPQCPFVVRFIERHPAYRDLLAAAP